MDGSTVIAVDGTLGLDTRGRGEWDLCKQAAMAAINAIEERQGIRPPVLVYDETPNGSRLPT